MASYDTHPATAPASPRRRVATITDIGTALRRNRNRGTADIVHNTVEVPVAVPHEPPLDPGAIVGYFRHEGRCIQVQYSASERLWLRERPYDDTVGALPDFDAYDSLDYAEFAQIIWPHRTLQFTYVGADVEPKWLPLPSASQADLMRKVLSLYDCVTKGATVNAADDLVPNPAPARFDPNRKGRHAQ